jgi:Helix-turn-helix domain of resolvase
MIIIGADYHPGFQQIAFVDTETGELQERRLQHREEAEKFYRDLATQGMKVRVGMEASGHARWFERLLSELQFELWIGDAAEIRTKLAHARQNGKRLGRPVTAACKQPQVLKLFAKGISKAEIARRLAIGRTSVRRVLATGKA